MFFMRGPSWTDADTILEDITTQDVDIVLRNGKPMEASLPFVNFKKANEARWGSIAVVLKHAEFVAKRYSRMLKMSRWILCFTRWTYSPFSLTVNCWALKAASIEVLAARIYNGQANPTSKDIMELSAVPEVTLMIAQRTGQRFIGELGKHNAAVLIQSVYKMYKTRCCYRRVQPYIHAGRVFLKYHRVHYRKTPLRATKDTIDEFHLKRVAELQKGMAKLWADKSLSKTVVIVSSVHVDPELKLHKSSTSYLHQRYFARAALLIDSKVNVIFVSSQDESEEVLNYRRTLMELHPEIQDFDQRFQVVVPEQHAMLKPNSSVAAMLLSSFATIQQIKAMIKGKAAFLFPGAVTMQEYRVASILEVPIYAPKLYLTKKLCKMSYARELAMDLGIPTPVGAESIESKEAFYERLSELICAHPEVTRWLFVVEHGIFMHQQIAYLDMHRFDFVRNCDALTLVPHLIAKLKEVVQILDGHRFNNSWEHYLEKLSRSHGTILAAYYDTNGREPIMDRTCLIHVDIDPRGAITYRGSTDMVTSEPHRILLEAIPQTRMSFSMVWAHTLRICERIHKLGGIGHFSVEFAVSTQKMMADSDQQIMLLRIYPYYTQQAINCDLAVVMGDASFEEASGKLMHDVHALMRRRIEFLKQARFFDMVCRRGNDLRLFECLMSSCTIAFVENRLYRGRHGLGKPSLGGAACSIQRRVNAQQL